jgi:hypothetical protein
VVGTTDAALPVTYLSVQKGDLTPDRTVLVVNYLRLGVVKILENKTKIN